MVKRGVSRRKREKIETVIEERNYAVIQRERCFACAEDLTTVKMTCSNARYARSGTITIASALSDLRKMLRSWISTV